MLRHVRVGRIQVLGCGIVEDHALAGAQDVVEDRLRQYGLGYGTVPQAYDDRVASGRGFRRYPIILTSRKDQYPSLGARMLNRCTHQRVNELLQDDLARYRL